MTLAQHTDYRIRYQQQVDNARSDVLPFIESSVRIGPDKRVLDIGCGEGGVLIPFLERGCRVTGIELDETKSGHARELLGSYIAAGQAEVVNQDIYEERALETYRDAFDLIILKDVIEHIPDQERFMPYLKQFLKPGGHVFLGFPPWYMPHGGHQQVCANRFLSMLPYFHLLPNPMYKAVLKMGGEGEHVINDLMEVKSTGISIERLERIARKSQYVVVKRTLYLVNPIYRYKFGWKPREQWAPVSQLPLLRNFVTTCAYYLLRAD